MRILHLIDTLEGGGAERVLINITEGLKGSECTSAVCCLHNRTELLSEIQGLGVETLVAAEDNYSFLQRWSAKQRRAHLRLFEFAGDFRPDIIHAHLGASYLVAYELHRKLKVPYVLHVHGEGRWWPGDERSLSGFPRKAADCLLRHFMARSFLHAGQVIAVSRGVEERILSLMPDLKNVAVLENCIHPAFFDTPPSGLPKVYDVVMCGRLVEDKNPLFALRVIKQLVDSGHSIKAVWIGDGPLQREFDDEVRNLGLEGCVFRLGWMDRDDLIKVFDQGRVLFLPSLSEGLPLVVAEALARGLHVVVSDLPSLKNTYHDVPCVDFFKLGDIPDGSNVISRVLNEAPATYQNEHVRNRFGREQYVTTLSRLYEFALLQSTSS